VLAVVALLTRLPFTSDNRLLAVVMLGIMSGIFGILGYRRTFPNQSSFRLVAPTEPVSGMRLAGFSSMIAVLMCLSLVACQQPQTTTIPVVGTLCGTLGEFYSTASTTHPEELIEESSAIQCFMNAYATCTPATIETHAGFADATNFQSYIISGQHKGLCQIQGANLGYSANANSYSPITRFDCGTLTPYDGGFYLAHCERVFLPRPHIILAPATVAFLDTSVRCNTIRHLMHPATNYGDTTFPNCIWRQWQSCTSANFDYIEDTPIDVVIHQIAFAAKNSSQPCQMAIQDMVQHWGPNAPPTDIYVYACSTLTQDNHDVVVHACGGDSDVVVPPPTQSFQEVPPIQSPKRADCQYAGSCFQAISQCQAQVIPSGTPLTTYVVDENFTFQPTVLGCAITVTPIVRIGGTPAHAYSPVACSGFKQVDKLGIVRGCGALGDLILDANLVAYM
jgi:hypothetical protein